MQSSKWENKDQSPPLSPLHSSSSPQTKHHERSDFSMSPLLQWLSISFTLILFGISVSSTALSHSDLVTRLPGQPRVGFEQYSGYVTVDDKKQRALFYYFAESEIDPISKPLVLWLNGGSFQKSSHSQPPKCEKRNQSIKKM